MGKRDLFPFVPRHLAKRGFPFGAWNPEIFDKWFDDVFDDDRFHALKAQFGKMGDVMVPVDFHESDSEFVLTAEIPGVDAKDLDIEFRDGLLTIKGEKKTETKDEKKGLYHSEISYGSVMRTIAVPDHADIDNAKADFKDGVLTMKMPKKEALVEGAKKIAINA